MDEGRMPNLLRLVESGVIGNLASLRPCLSPVLWTSIATGKTADKHGITGFVEPSPDGNGLRLASSTSRTTKALWNILSQNDRRCIVVNWYASHPAEPIRGTCISNRFFEGLPANPNDPWEIVPDSVHPETLAPVISGFRMHPAEIRVEDLMRFIPEIAGIDLARDRRPGQLAEVLARTISIQSIATGAMQAEPWDFMAVYFDGLDVAGHHFMPCHPPRLPTVGERDFALYQHVMRELYLLHDEMLGHLMALAGDETTVVLMSDHGFHSDHLRPQHLPASESPEAQAAMWHRPYGILAMRGPDLLKDERIYGATLLDIAPTVLAMFNLPIGRDMDGRPLLQAFAGPMKQISAIASWDEQAGEDGMHPADSRESTSDSAQAVAQLVALGYLPREALEAQKAIAIAVAESKFNLAVVHSSHAQPQAAQGLLEGLHQEFPANPRYTLALAKTYANLKLHDRSLALLKTLDEAGQRTTETDLISAAELFNTGRQDEALRRLESIDQQNVAYPGLHRLRGQFHLGRKEWQAAREAFSKCIELDDEDPHAHNGLAQAANQMGDFELAGEHALRAVGLLYFFPAAHFNLGMALKGLGDLHSAIRSLDTAVTQAPYFLEAHLEMGNIYDKLEDVPLWMKHRRIAQHGPKS